MQTCYEILKICTASVYFEFELGQNLNFISSFWSFPHEFMLQNFQGIIMG